MFLSIIIPVYNSRKYIGSLLAQLVGQLNSEIECILIDDGSVDNSNEVMRDYCDKSDSIRLFTQENAGAAAARQRGLTEATGKYVTFLDCDDKINEDYLENIVSILQNEPGRDMYVLSYTTFFSEKSILQRKQETAFYNQQEYINAVFEKKIQGVNALWNHIYSREFLHLNSICFDVESKIAEDCLFNDACLFNVKSVYVRDYAGYTWMCDHDSLTSRCPDNMWQTLRIHIDNLEKLKNNCVLQKDDAEKYIHETKIWAFNYLVHNIKRSRRSSKNKREYYKCILTSNIDEDTIKREYKGPRKAFLMYAGKHKSVMAFHMWYWSDLKIIKAKIFSLGARVYHFLGKGRDRND